MSKHHWSLGLDMSLRSPGLALCSPDNSWTMGYFAQTMRPITNVDHRVLRYPAIPGNKTEDIHRYLHIVRHVKAFVENTVPASEIPDVHVALEGYAFKIKASGSSYKLHELGGVLKSMLADLKMTKLYIVPPSKWKTDLNLKVKSDKWVAFNLARTLVTPLDLFKATNTPERPTKEVPNPVQDMGDAICLAHWLNRSTRSKAT